MDLLRRYRWPGNIRELKNMVERMAILAEEGSIEPCHLPPSFFNAAGTGPTSRARSRRASRSAPFRRGG